MQFPESWLREFCNPPLSTAELADLLTLSGFEVEETRPVAPPFSGVVVARIIAAEPHPQADRLQVCKVDAGAHSPDGPLQIVCGAPNARVGILVPLAIVGADLPATADAKAGEEPLRIGIGQLRGVESRGMLCSAKELQIADDHGGLLELAADAPPGADVRDWLKLDDTLFTLKLTPNLAHGLSVWGVAREVSALTGAPLITHAVEPVPPQHPRTLDVDVQASDLCGRFSGRVLLAVDPAAPTPPWMVERLLRCGQRSVSALVDISNYVMFESGQPSHIFDLDKIHDRLVVRWGRRGESLKLLNGNTVDVDGQVGVIADAEGVESLAGIMGGDATAVDIATTRNIYLEAAFWWPEAVAGRSRRYNFATDAGHRFERGVDPAQTVSHVERITQLIQQICGGQAGPVQDQTLKLPALEPVTLRVARAVRVLGMGVTQQQCADVFTRLGFAFTEGDGQLTVRPPSWRFDLRIEEDLIEEVVRVIGYHRLPDTPPVAPVVARVRTESQRSANAVRQVLADLGYQETISYSFVEARWEQELAGNAEPIRVLNPISAPLSVMRSSLIGSLVQVLRHNLTRRATRVQVFEIGRVFLRDTAATDGPRSVAGLRQPIRVAGLLYGTADPLQWATRDRGADFYDVKGAVESLLAPLVVRFETTDHPALHPGRSAAVRVGDRVIGVLGELHPRWRQTYELPHAPLLFELELDAVLHRSMPLHAPVPRQQAASRDVALVASERVSHDALVEALRADPQGLVKSATLFDVYKPTANAAGFRPGERSLAVRMELLDTEATLTDARIDAAVDAAVQRATETLQVRLRGTA
ncbi:MAG: phenylalanine--tRNA ligase subunit beta [Rubrivivax sp.]